MTELEFETNVYYLTECEACKHRAKYIVRADNVNTGLTDDNIMESADRSLGSYSNMVCEDCGLFSRHKKIGYRWSLKEES